jgi:hypothetical protein
MTLCRGKRCVGNPQIGDSPGRYSVLVANALRSKYGISEIVDFVRWHYDDMMTIYTDAGRNTISALGFDAVIPTLGPSYPTGTKEMEILGVAPNGLETFASPPHQ